MSEDTRKSILFWFQSLPDAYRKLAECEYGAAVANAVANPNKSPPDTAVDLCDAIVHAFDWDETCAGYTFWEGVYDWANTPEPVALPPLPGTTADDQVIACLRHEVEQLRAEAAVTAVVLDQLKIMSPALLDEAMAQARTRTHFKVRNVVQPQLNPQFLP